ncbi:hypothetical protein ACEQ8H_005412 [Pleosporales sp. CAS-2024a]
MSAHGLVPSRLLGFTTVAPRRGDADVVKLVVSSGLDEHTHHRWGRPGTLLPRTVESNLDHHVQQGIPYKELPRTFRDAVDIARGMGYGFLWIDSLCIIQDSPEDWKSEARRMAIIYDHSVFTIAAMDAESCSQGLFPDEPEPAPAPGSRQGGGGLESRAWVCQERMIAPRTLLFSSRAGGSVDWECRQATACTEAPELVEEKSGTVVGCHEDNWEPPTRPKAIFAFFRDWRLPPPIHQASSMDSAEDPEEQIVHDPIEAPPHSAGIHADETDRIGSGEHKDGDMIAQYAASEAHIPAEDDDADLADSAPKQGQQPSFTWSDGGDGGDDPRIKIWDGFPPKGESGVYVDHSAGKIYQFFGTDLAAHAANLASSQESSDPVLQRRSFSLHPDDDDDDDNDDPFGDFVVVVNKLLRPEAAYTPFMRVWWNFVALYTPRNLTYDSDAFLAMNGISSIAQRWTHIRNSFGLWFDFQQFELCWYVDDKAVVPAVRPTTPKWIVPSWSWASTRGGLVRNAIWEKVPSRGALMIKPVIGSASGTAFDIPLPFQAWRHCRYHGLEIKGNLRKASIRRVQQRAKEASTWMLDVEPTGRFSDHEAYTFYPDCLEEFPMGSELHVWTLLIWHYEPEQAGGAGQCVDVHLVLVSVGQDGWIEHYGPDTMEREKVEDERTMRRLGLVEMTYQESDMRDQAAIDQDMWWKYVLLV